MPGQRKATSTPRRDGGTKAAAVAPALPHKLHSLAVKTQVLEDTSADRLLAASSSRRRVADAEAGEALPRESIAALYSLATRLHSPALVFHAKSIETSAAKHVTTDQIWGQMSVLMRPVMRRLQDSVRRAERTIGKDGGTNGQTKKDRTAAAAKEAAATAAEDSDAGSELSEGDIDDAIAGLLKERRRRQQVKAQRRAGGAAAAAVEGDDNNAWRYAFGKGGDNEDNDEDDAEMGAGGMGVAGAGADDWGDGEDARGDGEDDAEGRMRDRNARAIMDAGEEEGDAEEELAALKEMYGEDFEDDGEGLMGGEDKELEKDLYYDDPSRAPEEMDDGTFAEGENAFYDEGRDGARFFGKDDMLNEDEALHSYGGDEAADPTQAGAAGAAGEEEEPYDEELERALADPNLTELERERLLEKKHIEKLEQKRLFGTDWAMAGETAARRRPREALLDVDDLEFDYGMKAVPVITEAFTGKLEDRIKQRIVEKNYDDVQRRTAFTTADDLVTTRKDAVLDSEKSKLSLMDLYEKEYMDKMRLAEEAAGNGAATAEPLTEIERDELRAINMWKRLSQHLDALSNFYYTPKPVQQDLEARVRAVDGAAPAIAMESVGNFAASRESALAPQDLYRGSARKLADVSAEELQPHERRTLRRAKKEEGKKFNERKTHRKQAHIKAREVVKKAAAAGTT